MVGVASGVSEVDIRSIRIVERWKGHREIESGSNSFRNIRNAVFEEVHGTRGRKGESFQCRAHHGEKILGLNKAVAELLTHVHENFLEAKNSGAFWRCDFLGIADAKDEVIEFIRREEGIIFGIHVVSME